MRKSVIKITPQKSRSISKSRLTSSPNSNSRMYSTLYYCHYKNAMYMGGIKSFKKEGRGILLHDNGLSVLTSYYNDLLHGHNVFFDNYSLLSAIYSKNKLIQAAYRTQGFLIFLTYNPERELDGKLKLLNFINRSIAYAIYRKGSMVDKNQQTDINLINRVFEGGQLELIIGRTHSKVFKYQFEKIPNIDFMKQANKIIVGFEKNGFINGLGFQFVYRGSQGGYNPDTHRNQDDFQLRVVERGYYINTQLNGIGSKIFKNGNLYVGEFKNGMFQGNGILKNSEKQNWVSGYFKNGNLVELLQYNSNGQNKNTDQIVAALHQRKTNWINNEICLQDLNFFIDQIQKMITSVPNKQVKNLQQRKQEVLKKIQQKFISDSNQQFLDDIEGSIKQLKNNTAGNSSISKFINNMTPSDVNNKISSSSRKQSDRIINKTPESNRLASSKIQNYRMMDSQINQQRPKNHISRAKIFQRSATSKSPIRSSNIHESQINQKFIHSPGWIKGNQQLSSSRKSQNNYNKPVQSEQNGSSKVWHPLTKTQFTNSRHSKAPPQVPNSNSYSLSSQQISFSNKTALDSKRMIAKNKIFKYLQNQQEQKNQQEQSQARLKYQISNPRIDDEKGNNNKNLFFRRNI